MAVIKPLLIITLAAVLFQISSAQQQRAQCKTKKCGAGEECRVFRRNCGSPGRRCFSREICIRKRTVNRASGRTISGAPTTRSTQQTNSKARPPSSSRNTFTRFNPATSGRTIGQSVQRLSFMRDCTAMSCPDGQYCKLLPTRCSSLPCLPVPRCRNIPPKPGTCPTVSVSRSFGKCEDTCSRDDQCEGNRKCCTEGCRMTCLEPNADTTPLKSSTKVEGVCPDFPDVSLKDCTSQCSQDTDCDNGHKCCKYGCAMRCVPQVNPSDPGERPNSCPFSPVPQENDPCDVNCTVDSHCPGIDKCCRTGCSMTCQPALAIHPPTRTRPGYCPKEIPDATCRTNCTVDSSCRGLTQKCCSFDCGSVCVDAILSPPGVTKPGLCPAITRAILATPCQEGCRFDDTCPGSQKCCQYGCVSVCREPEPSADRSSGRLSDPEPRTTEAPGPKPLAPGEKPGTCSKMSLSSSRSTCRDRCSNDESCPGRMKCCRHGCGKRCLNVAVPTAQRSCGRRQCTTTSCPAGHNCVHNGCNYVCVKEARGSDKAGSCPTLPSTFVIRSCQTSCSSDDSCSGSSKCCQYGPCKRCLPAVPQRSLTPKRKPTQCPDMPATSNVTSCEPTCTSDRSCSGGEICCPYGCSTKCLPPKEEVPQLKPLYCPTTRDSITSFTCYKSCSSDSECSGTTKCCGNGCNSGCTTPKTKRPKVTRRGSCPASTVNSPTTNCVSTCSSDFACRVGEKCCFNGCRRECVTALRTEDPKKPGFCPKSVQQTIGSYRDFRRFDCGVYCNSDFSCPGDMKCCRQGCKTSCVAIESSPPPVIKAGFCPASTTDSGTCVRSCTSDLTCQGNQKCCFQGGCVQKCSVPVSQRPAPRQGMCPLVNPLPPDQCKTAVEFCNSDHACPDPLKCCFDGCTNRCLNPESSIVSTKEGFCPSFSSDNSSACLVQCSTDDSCPGSEKCCSVGCAVKCVPPLRVPPKDKAGFCPFIPLSLSSTCQQSCQLDDSCPGTMKCCQNGCSRRCYSPVALPPAISKAGFCPATVANPTCDTPCTSDGTCPGEQKCCKLSCGMSCVAAVSDAPDVKRGFCPFVHPNISTMCLHTCSSDYSCPGDSKCCSYGSCSMRCMQSERFPHAITKAGDCPASRGAFGRPNRVLCLSDYSCPGENKCCRVGNNVQCSPPQQNFRAKAGVCPNIRNTSPVCRQRCTNDNHCSGDRKCCKAGCSTVCVSPALEATLSTNEGFCPYVELHVMSPCLTNCTSDGDCSSDQKCCEYGCGMRCMKSQPFAPGTVKSGTCPSPRALNPLYSVPRGAFWFLTRERPSRETYGYRNCRNDGQCPGTLKCCFSSVGGTECTAPR